eukprot:15430458-Alexandrium_andersonii.AAC.2
MLRGLQAPRQRCSDKAIPSAATSGATAAANCGRGNPPARRSDEPRRAPQTTPTVNEACGGEASDNRGGRWQWGRMIGRRRPRRPRRLQASRSVAATRRPER